MPSKRAIILNPFARRETARTLRHRLSRLVGATPIWISETIGEATALAGEAARKGCRVVVAAGGDGTVNEVANGLVGTDAVLGILPLGSVNVLARELGIPPDLERAWQVIEAGATRPIDLVRTKYQAKGQELVRHFVQLAGVGLDAHIVRKVSWAQKKRWGPLSYVFEAVRSFRNALPRLTVTFDGRTNREGSLLLVGNGAYYGGSIPVFARASHADGWIDACLFASDHPLDLLRYLQAVLRGVHLDSEGVEYRHARNIEVAAPSPSPVQLDGEFVGYSPCRMEVLPGALSVRTPR